MFLKKNDGYFDLQNNQFVELCEAFALSSCVISTNTRTFKGS